MKRIAELRKEKHYSQLKLANMLGISQKTVSGYETGVSNPSIDLLIEMSEIFDTSIDYIVENSNIKDPINKVMEGEFSKEDKEMMVMFKRLSYPKKLRVLGMISALEGDD